MIRLSVKRAESSVFSHTGSNGGAFYSVTHNFGAFADYVMVQIYVNVAWINLEHYISAGGLNWGFDDVDSSSINHSKVKVYNLRISDDSDGYMVTGATPLKVIAVKFN